MARDSKSPPRRARQPASAAVSAEGHRYTFPIVGIGASAGGLEAVTALLRAAPDNMGMAFIAVFHLSPDKKSHMADILGRETKMRVVEAGDGSEIAPEHVYVIPPSQYLAIEKGHIRLFTPNRAYGERHPVDMLFASLAHELSEKAVGIVMSGTGTNGTAGLLEIKAAGGLALAQSPESAGFDGMPRSAIDAGVIDSVLRPETMPEVLRKFAEHSYVRTGTASEDFIGTAELGHILAVLRVRTAREFSGYKKGTVTRRIHRRMSVLHIDDLKGYLAYLHENPDEVQALSRDLLITVSGFFRDPEAWDALADKVVDPWVRERRDGEQIRAWVPGCASGEEAYSIAMLIAERAGAAGKSFDVKVFASDLAQDAIGIGRNGVFPEGVANSLSPQRLTRFFDKTDGAYRVHKDVRDQIIFAHHDILHDPPFSRLDLISCRNLLIYLEPDVQRRLAALFHFSLRSGGILFLGNAENVPDGTQRFEPVSSKWRIFRRIGETNYDLEFPVRTARERWRPMLEAARARGNEDHGDRFYRTLAETYAPAAVLIDREGRILYFHGDTDPYLAQPSGEPTLSLYELAREGLRGTLKAAVQKALSETTRVSEDARVERSGARQAVSLEVVPVPPGKGYDAAAAIVTFRNRDRGRAASRRETAPDRRADEGQDLRTELRTAVQDLEASNEELKAANEEITSINEELQSANEELETSKEELQSLNEELNTVNSQLQAKLDELERTNNNLSNLLSSTDMATIFLDRELNVRWFTPQTKTMLDLLPGDVGRPIGHFAPKFSDGDLVADARAVLETLRPSDRTVRSDDARWYIRRVLPYRTADHRIDGVVVTFIETTDLKKSEEQQRVLVNELRHRVRNMLAVVRAIAQRTRRSTDGESRESYFDAFDTRLSALARAQSLVVEGADGNVDLETLLRAEMGAHGADDNDGTVSIVGPKLALSISAAQMISLAMNELATNALKHGALGEGRGGHIAVQWSIDGRGEDRRVRLAWKESGLAAGAASGRKGQGLDLIEQGVPYNLGGSARVEFEDGGVRCTIEFPVEGNVSMASA